MSSTRVAMAQVLQLSKYWSAQSDLAASDNTKVLFYPSKATVPVTVEGPDGSRHGMDVELEGLRSMAELRRGMLQGYRELLGISLPSHALRVQARLSNGQSVLLSDSTPLSLAVGQAVSFYVWASTEPAAGATGGGPAPGSVEIPTVRDLKGQLEMRARGL